MGEFKKLSDPGVLPAPFVVAEERLFVNADDELVPDGSPHARFLFCVPGDEIPRDVAIKYGLLDAGEHDAPAEPESSSVDALSSSVDALSEPEAPAEEEPASSSVDALAEDARAEEAEADAAEEKPKAKKQKG